MLLMESHSITRAAGSSKLIPQFPETHPLFLEVANFVKAFTGQGGVRELPCGIPVQIIFNDQATLPGAAWSALEGDQRWG